MAGLLKVKRFEETSSAALEIRTVLWALEEYKKIFALMEELKKLGRFEAVSSG